MLNQKKKAKTKRSNLLTSCFMCVSNSENEDESYFTQTDVSLQPCLNLPAKPKPVPISTDVTEPVHKQTEKDQKPEENITITEPILEKNYKDQLIRTILNKYLESKRTETQKNENDEEVNKEQTKPESPRKNEFLSIECYSSDSFETLVLGTKVDFPTKTKSAPTTSTAHDSLADICDKMSYKHENKSSESYITCCSEENANTNVNYVSCSEENTNANVNDVTCSDENTANKKLELIFDQSSEEISSCLEDNSVGSLKYEISCQGKNYKKHTKQTCQELYVRPTAKGEIGESTASLKWKLIISHHDHGDFSS